MNSKMQNRAVYTIGVMADLLGVHPETLRVWERHGLVKPKRKNTHRLYTDLDLRRILFIQELLNKGLNLAGISEYLTFYPCWLHDNCPNCMRKSENENCAKPCWKEKGTYCQASLGEANICDTCKYRASSSKRKRTAGVALQESQV